MGFNFGLARVVDGKALRQGYSDGPRTHAPTCEREDDEKDSCMCEYGFDCFRHTSDREFFSWIANNGKRVSDEWDEGYYRPTDFAAGHAHADMMDPEINRPRFHELLDLLEKDPDLYVASE